MDNIQGELFDEREDRRRAVRFAEAGGADTERQRAEPPAMVKQAGAKQILADPDGPLLVRIGRHAHSSNLDDDNLIGGCKALRDAIASALGRKGDSEADGLRFRYYQSRDAKAKEAYTTVEIFRDWEKVKT